MWMAALSGFLHVSASFMGQKISFSVHLVVHLVTQELYTALELSVSAFLLHVQSNTGVKDLSLTALVVAFVVPGIELILLAVAYEAADIKFFGFGYNLDEELLHDRTVRWGYWAIRSGTFALLYLPLAFCPTTQWERLLPLRTHFEHYFHTIFAVHAGSAAASLMLLLRVTSGFCVFAIFNAAYYALMPSTFYAAFLHDAFKDTAADIRRPLLDAVEDAETERGGSAHGYISRGRSYTSMSQLSQDTGYNRDTERESDAEAPFAEEDEDLSPLPLPRHEERGIH